MTPSSGPLHGSIEQQIGNALVVAAFAAATTALTIWAIREWRRRRSPDLGILLLGAVPSTLSDAQARLLAGLHTAPATDHPVYYRAFDVTISPYMATAFPVYIAGAGYLAFLALTNHWPRARFWKMAAVLYATEFAFEQCAINLFHLYTYQGNQPYKIFGLPPAWPAAFIMTGLLTGALQFLLGGRLHGPRRLLLLPLPAGAYAAAYGLVCWPLAAAVHSAAPALLVEGASTLSLATMGVLCYLITTFLPCSSPTRELG
ncbi:hypothetical protein [Actinomadura chibensis]|uniref:Carotenoid biosynthesis protein n=1 Tax=Actinomadura chibensis TaxID=392828 RepID=A0A5D0NMC8_9ACTN|nr:hypothetical protein [Actinomadura chibensis]TYB45612.1 hypothetical protein FXF69_19490 [Actinomadura chibensis]